MSGFKVEMHQIRFPLGLHARPHWGSLQRSPRPVLKRAYFSGEGGERRRKRGKRKMKAEGKGREWKEGGERPYAPPVANSWLRH